MQPDLLNQIKAAKVSVQLAMEMCDFKSEIGAELNGVWEQLHSLTERAKDGEL